MARATANFAFLGIQKTEFDNVKNARLFVGDEPDNKTDVGLSVLSMVIHDDVIDELFSLGAGIDPLEQIEVTFDIDRGSKNAGKMIALALNPVKKPSISHVSAKPAGTPAKPE